MHHFQDGEQARIIRRGVEVEVSVFRQVGEFVYIFDKEKRPFQFHVRDVLPAGKPRTESLERESRHPAAEECAS